MKENDYLRDELDKKSRELLAELNKAKGGNETFSNMFDKLEKKDLENRI